MKYEEISSKFLEFEKDNNLLSLNVNGVYVWEIIRTYVFLAIVDYNVPANDEPLRRSFWQKLQILFRRLFVNSLFFNPFLDFRKSDVLIFDSGRKYFVDDSMYIDIYTYYYSKRLRDEKLSLTKYETNYNADLSLLYREKSSKHLDFIFLTSKILSRFKKFRTTSVDSEQIDVISSKLTREFGCKINLTQMFAVAMDSFFSELSMFNLLFKLKQPKEIYIVNSTDKPALIYAAKQNNILVNELQHGLMSDKDVISNFPYTKEGALAYFPDRFFVWNNVNMFFGKLPLKTENIVFFENEHITNLIRLSEAIQRKDNSLLIISQPYGSDKIQEFIINNVENIKDFNIVYKIHPAESLTGISKFILECNKYKNLRFINNEESIYSLMKESKYVVGVYSSALFEATSFNCEILLLDLPGVEMSLPLVEKGFAKIVHFKDSLKDILV